MTLDEKIEIVATSLAYEFSKKELYEEIKWLLEQLYEVKRGIESDYEYLFREDSPYNLEKRQNPNIYERK
tara:strand:+ start:626 stop:835 length:210 start_codon:yes stop_codon:yes gene_type:complete